MSIVGQFLRERGSVKTQHEALVVLRQRCATGNIDEEAFEEQRTKPSTSRYS